MFSWSMQELIESDSEQLRGTRVHQTRQNVMGASVSSGHVGSSIAVPSRKKCELNLDGIFIIQLFQNYP